MNKNLLKKIKYLLLPILLISVLFLTIPDIACALMPVKDWTQAAMDGLEEKYGPFAAFFLEIIIIYIILLVALWIVTSIFDWAIRLNLEYLVVVDNPATAQVENAMVAAGFDFISGIANMMLILIFIYIAFAIILKIESVGAKKILPRLIIVAFLLNFSLVFIGMVIDITNIFYVTFLPATGYPLVWNIVEPLLTSAATSIEVLFAAFIINALTLMIPIVNIGVMAATIVTAPFILIPIIINLFLQAFIFILLIGIFLFYIALFIGRIVIIQILAILAPLAFICLILPQTKKYFNMWVKHFLSWLFVGLFLLFFLRLGFLLFGILAAQLGIGGATPLAIPFIGNIGAFFTFYLFVIIYLAILVTMAKKAIPEFAQAALSQAGSLAKYATAGWAMTGGHAFRHGIVGGRTGQIGDDIAERAGRIGARIGGGSGSMTRVARWATGQAEKAGKDMAIGGRESLQKQGDKDKKECEGKSKEELGQITEGGPLTSDSRRMAASNQLSADGDADEDKMTDTEKVKLYKRQKAKGDTTAVKDFAANNIHLHEELGITKEVPSALSDEDRTRIENDVRGDAAVNNITDEDVIKQKIEVKMDQAEKQKIENIGLSNQDRTRIENDVRRYAAVNNITDEDVIKQKIEVKIEEEEEQKLQGDGFDGSLLKNIRKTKADNKKALEKVIKRKLKKSPESMSANILENEQTSRAVLENINSSQISRAVNADNTDFVNKISEKLKDMKAKDSTTLKEILNTNHSLRIHIESGMAQRNMGIDKDFLNSLNLN